MNNDWLDIGVLEDYLDGKLDAKTMNRVEREALEDPFVAEALAGLSAAPKRSLASISLLQKQLKERVAEHQVAKKTKVITWQRLSIAATAAVLFIAVSIIFWMKEVAQQNQLAKQGKEVDVNLGLEVPVVAKNSDSIAGGPVASAGVADGTLAKLNDKNKHPSAKAKTTVTPELASPGAFSLAGPTKSTADAARQEVAVAQALQAAKSNSYAANAKKKASAIANNNDLPVTQRLSGTVAGLEVASTYASASPMTKSMRMMKLKTVPSSMLAGKVVSEVDGKPIVGAAVQIVPGAAGTLVTTDLNGEFKIPADSLLKDYTIAVSYPGFAPNRLVARLNEPIDITLKKQAMFGSAFNPMGGWEKYNQYLQENNQLTKAQTLGATLEISFLIGKDGKPYDFKILRSLGPQYEKEAIRLISEGPGWEQPSHPEGRVRLGVKF